nr:DDE-type integrase/transposase/recombinase [uncultured Roseovarius sp.]
MAVRWYCRYSLSCRDVRNLLAERGVTADASTIHRYVRKFGPEIRERAYGAHRSWRGLQWHVDRKYLNNRIKSDHASLKQRLRHMRGFQTLVGAKAALAGIETFRTIRKGQFENCEIGVANEINFVAELFPETA